MSKLPQISGKECIKTLEKAGFYIKRQKGSHIIFCRDEPFAEVVVSNHKNLDKGTLRAIIRQAELDVDEFIELLKNQWCEVRSRCKFEGDRIFHWVKV